MARVRALLRGAEATATTVRARSRFDDLTLDSVAHEVHRGERRLELTRTEFAPARAVHAPSRQVLSRSTIFEHVWGYDFGAASNTLGSTWLPAPQDRGRGEPRLLHTVRGVGYILRSP